MPKKELIHMKCPYNRKSETQILQWTQEPDEQNETVLKSGGQITKTSFELMECTREACGAFYRGRCCYASVNLNNE